MPIYLVRGPATWGALIRAHDLEHAYFIVDELHDPGTCVFSEYTGPLALEFELPATVGLNTALGDTSDDLEVVLDGESIDLAELPSVSYFEETGSQMRDHLLQLLFPAVSNLAEAWNEGRPYGESHIDTPAHAEELRDAIASDVRDRLKTAQWREASTGRGSVTNAATQALLRVTVDPAVLERGGETHAEWQANNWGPLPAELCQLADALCETLQSEDLHAARSLAATLRDRLAASG